MEDILDDCLLTVFKGFRDAASGKIGSFIFLVQVVFILSENGTFSMKFSNF